MREFERKFGKYAIKNLSLILVICYAVGYLLSMNSYGVTLLNYLSLNPYYICRGQIWRLVTWIVMPPDQFDLLTLITLFFYYSIGRSLENAWGDFMYNVYIFSGMLFTVIGSFVLMLILFIESGGNAAAIPTYMTVISNNYISTYYISMSIFLAFAATFPEARVLLMFIIPIKVKWLGYVYAALLVYQFVLGNTVSKVVIGVSLLNFIIFFISQRSRFKGSPKQRVKMAKRRMEYRKSVRAEEPANGMPKHKCAICGRTELDGDDLEFRFCSKCNGNYEYCQEHLFTHTHVE